LEPERPSDLKWLSIYGGESIGDDPSTLYVKGGNWQKRWVNSEHSEQFASEISEIPAAEPFEPNALEQQEEPFQM